MKKFIVVFLCLITITFNCGCEEKSKNETPKTDVIINLPDDETVNGYRIPENKIPDKIGADEVLPDSDNLNLSFCGNKNSKKFHKLDCSSLKNTKDENKVYYSSRDAFINKGYTPCKKCNP